MPKHFYLFSICILLNIGGCATNVKQETREPIQTNIGRFNSISEFAQATSASIGRQTGDLISGNNIPVDIITNETSAEVTDSSKEFQNQIVASLSKAFIGTKFEPVTIGNAASARWIVLATFSVSEAKSVDSGWLRLNVALAEVATGRRIAFSVGYLPLKVFSTSPTNYFKESPVYNAKDASFQAKVAALKGEDSKTLGNALNFSTLYAEGVAYYEDGQFATSAKKFFDLLKVAPNHIGALSGLYQSYWRNGLKKEAEQAFLMLAETGIDAGAVSVRLMFSVGTTNFVNSGDLSEQYRIWQKGIAQAAVNRKRCLDVVGHASKTGVETNNEKLSLQRASRITINMQQLVPASRDKFRAIGKGSAEALVGSGTDDMSDAIDRRVEFAVQSCSG